MAYELQVGSVIGSSRVSSALSLIASNWRITTQFSRQGFHPEAGVTHRYRALTKDEGRMHTAAVNYLSRNFSRLAQLMGNIAALSQSDADDVGLTDFIYAAQDYINRCRAATTEIDAGDDAMFGSQDVPPYHEARVLTADEEMCYESAVAMLTAMFEFKSDTETTFMANLLEDFVEDE